METKKGGGDTRRKALLKMGGLGLALSSLSSMPSHEPAMPSHEPARYPPRDEQPALASAETSGNHGAPVGLDITYYFESREPAEKRGKSRGQFFLDELGEPVISALQETAGGVALAIGEAELKRDSKKYDAALIEALQALKARGIPFDLWANLPDEEGYWIYRGNIDEARAGILRMLNAAEQRGINFRSVGLDLEMKGPELGPAALWANLKLAPDKKADAVANEKLRQFITEVLAAGTYGVDTYELPVMSDSEFLRRRLGILRAPTREEIAHPRYDRVGMVYRTVYEMSMPGAVRLPTPRFISKYSHEMGRTAALGMIASGEENPGRGGLDPKRLVTDEQLGEDIRAALAGRDLDEKNKRLFIFALDGLPVIARVRNAVAHAIRPID